MWKHEILHQFTDKKWEHESDDDQIFNFIQNLVMRIIHSLQYKVAMCNMQQNDIFIM